MLSILLATALALGPPQVSAETLRARYGGLRSLTADVVQVKTGRFWARPFESRIRLRYTPERIVWETVKPISSTVVIEGARLEITDSRGVRSGLAGGAAGDPRVGALLGFLRALLAVDLTAIERDFVLEYGPGEVTATPRPGSAVPVFKKIALQFDGDANLETLLLESDAEQTRLTFSRVERGAQGDR